jgi:mannan endo-1,6-alpha-mannosidase
MEMFGKDTMMPGGVSYGQVTDKTYQQVQAQEDPTCGGGIWWSRNRNDEKNKNYKSSITLTQQMMKGARMFILTRNQKYQTDAERTYAWMKSARLIDPSGAVNDGLDANGCRININRLSYKSGFLVGALSWMFQATKNPEFLEGAHLTFNHGLTAFAPDGIIRDQCEPSRCQKNQVSAKGTMVRGWGYLQEFTTDAQIRSRLRQVLRATTEAMLDTCDNNLNCLDNWASRVPVSASNPSDVHQQINAVELMTSYLKTFTSGPAGQQKVAAPTQAPAEEAEEPGSAFGMFRSGVSLLVLGTVMTLFF